MEPVGDVLARTIRVARDQPQRELVALPVGDENVAVPGNHEICDAGANERALPVRMDRSRPAFGHPANERMAVIANRAGVEGVDVDVRHTRVAPPLAAGTGPAGDLKRLEALCGGPCGDLLERQVGEGCSQEAELHAANIPRPVW